MLLVAAVICNSCTDLTNVENRLGAVEKDVANLQTALKDLKSAYEKGKIIKTVEPTDSASGGWVVTFSDGQSIALLNGKDGGDGADGIDGENGADGITPYMLVDQDGFWCVSYDGGESFTRIMDNAGNYVKAIGEKGDSGEQGEQGEQGEKGNEGLSVRVSTDKDGYYTFLTYYASSPDEIIETIVTPYQSDPSKVLKSISQDDQTNVITISLADGNSYTFNKDYAVPTGIAVLTTNGARLGKGTTATVEFRVNPSNAKFNYIVGDAACAIELDLVGKTRAGSYVTAPTNYRLTKVEQVNDEQGQPKVGQYRATIQDARVAENYIEDAAFVLTVSNANNEEVQISSSAFKVAFSGNVMSEFSFLKADNEGVLGDVEIDVEGNNVDICTPLVADASKLVATFVTNGEKVFANGVEQVSGVSVNDFTSPVEYTVISSEGARNVYTVALSGTGLPTVVINTPNGATIPPKTEDWLEGTYIKVINADGTVGYEGSEDNIRGRGNSTWGYPKKPYALKLDKKAEILGMPKHKRWVLLANWMDRTLLRNRVAFKLAQETCMEWTPRGEFVEVVLNGEHVGNYYLCEHIKVDENRVNIVEMEETDTEGDAITGGYLLELDVNYDEVNKFNSPLYKLPYMFKEPDEDVMQDAQYDYMWNYVSTLESSLYEDVRFGAREYAEYIDIDTYIDWWIVHELTFNGEPNHPKSTYMHKDRNGKLKAGPVWDFDWGTFIPTSSNFRISESVYYGRLFQDPVFVQRVKERWQLLKPKFEEVPAFIAGEKEKLAKSDRLNIKMWPISSRTNGDETLSYDDAVARMTSAYEARMEKMDLLITNL